MFTILIQEFFAFRMEGQEELNVLVRGTFVSFSILLEDVCLFLGMISSLLDIRSGQPYFLVGGTFVGKI